MADVQHLVTMYESRSDSVENMKSLAERLRSELDILQEKSARMLSKPPTDNEKDLFALIQQEIRQKRMHIESIDREVTKLEKLSNDEELKEILKAVEKAEAYKAREMEKLNERVQKLSDESQEEHRENNATSRSSKVGSKSSRSAIKSKRKLDF